ncbi:hypothetical protein Hanom_Chr14g01289331 [Helianthus anomalus]
MRLQQSFLAHASQEAILHAVVFFHIPTCCFIFQKSCSYFFISTSKNIVIQDLRLSTLI